MCWDVDYVFSHTGPLKYLPIDEFSDEIDQSTVDQSTEIWLDKIEDRLSYITWYFGHFHCDMEFDHAKIMFEEIEELGE